MTEKLNRVLTAVGVSDRCPSVLWNTMFSDDNEIGRCLFTTGHPGLCENEATAQAKLRMAEARQADREAEHRADLKADLLTVKLTSTDVRALAAFVEDDSAGVPRRRVPTDEEWERIGIALHNALAEYDGPDGDDGRDWTPPYEP